MTASMNKFYRNVKRRFSLRPSLLIVCGFFLLILVGSILLTCPFSLQEGVTDYNYLNSLFTATSSTCVTGLLDIPNGLRGTYTLAGQIIILIMIQFGGLGVTAAGMLLIIFIFRKITYKQSVLLKEAWNLESTKEIKKIFYLILIFTLCIEVVGAILSFISLYCIHGLELGDAIFYGVFHSISSYNNAGLDLFGTSSLFNTTNALGQPTSILPYADPLLLITTAVLITIGGLGYLVILDALGKKFRFRKFRLQTKMVLVASLFLFVVGSLLIFLTSYKDGSFTVGPFDSMFLSVSTRTAGFSTLDLSQIPSATRIFMCGLMFVGASPGGTGGGIKTTTMFVIVLYLFSAFNGKDTHIFRRNIPKDLIKKSLIIFAIGITLTLIGAFVIDLVEGGRGNSLSFDETLFEAISAYGTVGLSTGITTNLHEVSRVTLIILMFVGRVGPLSLPSLVKPNDTRTWSYVEENIAVG